ncbi:MAG TPA: bifunctional DNA primase/polymerase [Actinocrinis sp.]|nr:bifunctional DNA primase/polymerase [Actinocrinis sp.]
MSTISTAAARRTDASVDRLGLAIALAERGFAVFPLRPGSKVPAVREDWEGLAVADPRRLRELGWPQHANFGIACGPSGLFVLDLDVQKQPPQPSGSGTSGSGVPSASDREPRSGAQALRALADGRPIPRTFTVTTPSGGIHLYFRAPKGLPLRNTVARLGPLIDTRAAGGYVVAPGSTIGRGRYEIVDDVPIAPVPRWIVRELVARSRQAVPQLPSLAINRSDVAGSRIPSGAAAAYGAAALRNEVERMRAARVGTRNDTLNRSAYALGRLVGAGLLERDLAESELFHAARQAGLPARECASTLASGLGAGIARPRFPARRRPDARGTAMRIVVTEPPSREVGAAHDAASDAAGYKPVRARRRSARDRGDERVFAALRVMDEAYDNVALSAAALAFSQDWRRIRALMDALRDLRDAAHFGPAQRRHAGQLSEAVRDLAATVERTVQGSARRAPGRRRTRSPLAKALRDLKLAANAAIEAVEGPGTRQDARKAAA